MPRVSVIMPVYNQPDLALDAICSVFGQTFEDWELLLIDDGSTESLESVINRFRDDKGRVRFYRSPENKGIPHGSIFGMQEMRGDYFMILAADEWMQPENLALKVKHLDEHPEVDAVFSLPRSGEKGERTSAEQYALRAHNRSREQWLRTLLEVDMVPLGSCTGLFRRRVYETIGSFRPDLLTFSDHEWFCRFFENFQCHVIPYRLTIDQSEGTTAESPSRPRTEAAVKRVMAELEKVRELHTLRSFAQNKKVSVWVPVYNLAPYVRATLDGILAQTYADWEMLIVDDCSTDDSAKVIQAWAAEKNDPRVKVRLLDKNIGQRAICNMALAEATGAYCMEMSADDVVAPTFMARCMEIFDLNPDLEMVSTQTDFIDAEGKPYEADHAFKHIAKPTNRTQEEWKATFWGGNLYFGVSIYRTDGVREVGGWNPEHWVISDYALYLALVHRSNIFVIEEDLTHTRIRGDNQSAQVHDRQRLAQCYTNVKRTYYPERRRVVFATAYYLTMGYAPYISAMMGTIKLLNEYGIDWQYMDVSGDSYVQRAKNTIINRFLEMPDATDLFMIDSDMWWDAPSVVKMLMMPEDIVVASYRTKNAWDRWTSTPLVEKDEKTGEQRVTSRSLPDGSHLLKGGNLAGGFMRFKRGVLERFKEFHKTCRYQDISADPTNRERVYTEFFACETKDGLFWGEDRVFSRRLREMKQDWWIYPNVHTGHYGMREHMGNFHDHLVEAARRGSEPQSEGLTPAANWDDKQFAKIARGAAANVASLKVKAA